MEIETYEDGWDCEPKLKSAMESIEKCDHFKYEIDKCVRESELDEMVYEMIDFLQEAIDTLKEIDTNKEYKTVENYE